MPTQVLGMYGDITGGGQDAIASLDIPTDGYITGVDWDVEWDCDADTEFLRAELSFVSTTQIQQNDVRGRISSVSSRISFTTSGLGVGQIQKFVGPLDTPVNAGERLYLHVTTTAGVVGNLRCNLHLDVSLSRIQRRFARRR